MSFVFAVPEEVIAAASNVADIGSTIASAGQSAAAPTSEVAAAAADQVSAVVAAAFNAHGAEYQTFSSALDQIHQQFLQALTSGAGAYAATESANASPLQSLLGPPSTPG